MSFHINAMGKALKCSAKHGRCPFGNSDDHYDTAEKARDAYENHMEEELTKVLNGLNKKAFGSNVLRYDPMHPNSVREDSVIKDCVANRRPMTTFERERHANYVEEVISNLESRNLTTEHTHAQSTKYGLFFNSERTKAHQEIIDEILESSKSVPSEGKALFAGGLGGAGKSTVLENYADIDKSQYVTLNPDDIKEIMAEKGLIPKVEGLTPMEASPLVHEEASHITSVLLEKLRMKRKNIIFDITMASQGSVQNRINLITESGYTNIEAIFVDITPETSAKRGDSRYVYGLNQYTEKGEGQGGRPLPARLTKAQKPQNPSYNSKNAEVLIALTKLKSFTSKPRIFDNDVAGREPVEMSFKNFSKS